MSDKGKINKRPVGKLSPMVKMEVAVKKLGKFFVDLLFPEDLKCVFCGTDIPNFDEKPYCEECEKNLPFNNGHRCEICDQPILNEATICDFCQKRGRNFKRAFCPFLYEGKVKNAILGYKESNQRFKAKAFAKMIVEYIQKFNVKLDVVTYIPMTEKKQKQRTFNQSQLLAEQIGKLLNLPVLSFFSKVRDGEEQKNLTFKERRESVVGKYVLKKVRLKRTQNVLIVDDVMTTGATLGYCAGLVYPKVNEVYVCALAREYVRPKAQAVNSRKFSQKSKSLWKIKLLQKRKKQK